MWRRAFFWGTVLALWGSAGAVLSLGRLLGIKKPEDTNQVLSGCTGSRTPSFRPSLRCCISGLALPGTSAWCFMVCPLHHDIAMHPKLAI